MDGGGSTTDRHYPHHYHHQHQCTQEPTNQLVIKFQLSNVERKILEDDTPGISCVFLGVSIKVIFVPLKLSSQTRRSVEFVCKKFIYLFKKKVQVYSQNREHK